MKSLLYRKLFTIVNIVYIVLNFFLAVEITLADKHSLPIQIITAIFSILIAIAIFILSIYCISIDFMMYEIYLGIFNAWALVSVIVLSFLLYFQEKYPWKVFLENIPIIIVLIFSVLVSVYVAYVRKCIIDGLVQPVFMQRKNKIESRVVLVKREYPEIFSIQ